MASWLHAYMQKSYFDIDPVFQTILREPGTQHWQATYRNVDSEKQQEFMTEARKYGLGDGITTGSADPACRVATFCSFASADNVDVRRYMLHVEYFGYYVHLALQRTAPKTVQSMDRCIKQLTMRS